MWGSATIFIIYKNTFQTMKSKYQKDWDRGESFVRTSSGLVPTKYVVARNISNGKTIEYSVWKKMSNEEQDLYELKEMS